MTRLCYDVGGLGLRFRLSVERDFGPITGNFYYTYSSFSFGSLNFKSSALTLLFMLFLIARSGSEIFISFLGYCGLKDSSVEDNYLVGGFVFIIICFPWL